MSRKYLPDLNWKIRKAKTNGYTIAQIDQLLANWNEPELSRVDSMFNQWEQIVNLQQQLKLATLLNTTDFMYDLQRQITPSYLTDAVILNKFVLWVDSWEKIRVMDKNLMDERFQYCQNSRYPFLVAHPQDLDHPEFLNYIKKLTNNIKNIKDELRVISVHPEEEVEYTKFLLPSQVWHVKNLNTRWLALVDNDQQPLFLVAYNQETERSWNWYLVESVSNIHYDGVIEILMSYFKDKTEHGEIRWYKFNRYPMPWHPINYNFVGLPGVKDYYHTSENECQFPAPLNSTQYGLQANNQINRYLDNNLRWIGYGLSQWSYSW